MKLFSAKEILEWELYTMKKQNLSDFDLMLKASTLFANWVDKKLLKDNMPIAIICGWGNNAADGYLVGKILMERKSPVVCYDLSFGIKKSALCIKNKNNFEGKIIEVEELKDLNEINRFSIVIDAILGIGANRAFGKQFHDYINYINKHAQHIQALDIPSGMLSDEKTNHLTINADETLTFTAPKISFFSSTNSARLGTWVYRDIGLSKPYKLDKPTPIYLTLEYIRGRIKKRKPFGHKGLYGHTLLIGSGNGKAGAILLAGKAAYKMGSGLVTLASIGNNRIILQTSLPEAMFIETSSDKNILDSLQTEPFKVIGIGPGLGTDEETASSFLRFLTRNHKPIVLDADAINIIAQKNAQKNIPKNAILTPHPKEFERLFGACEDDFERRIKQLKYSKELQVFIILKGAYTTITTPNGDVFYNSTGNPGMAVGGSGDVLTGMISSLLAQDYSHEESCLLAVYLHGLAGDIATKELGEMSMISSDLIERFPLAINTIK